MTLDELRIFLLANDACSSALEWVGERSGSSRSAYDLWRVCHRGDWLLWFALTAGAGERTCVRLAAEEIRRMLDDRRCSRQLTRSELTRCRAFLSAAVRALNGSAKSWPSHRAEVVIAADEYYIDSSPLPLRAAAALVFGMSKIKLPRGAVILGESLRVAAVARHYGYDVMAGFVSGPEISGELERQAALVRSVIPWHQVRDALASRKGG